VKFTFCHISQFFVTFKLKRIAHASKCACFSDVYVVSILVQFDFIVNIAQFATADIRLKASEICILQNFPSDININVKI